MVLIRGLWWIVLVSKTYRVSMCSSYSFTAAFLATVPLATRGKCFPLLVTTVISLKILLNAGASWFASSIRGLRNITVSLRVQSFAYSEDLPDSIS